MANQIPAEVFPPGEILRDELEVRGWSQVDFAEIIGKTPRLVNEIITGKRSITPETARAIAEALGTSAQFWMNLETAYRLSRVETPYGNSSISRRARLYIFPIREMSRRGWIDHCANINVLEHQLSVFFGVKSIEEVPYLDLAHAARRPDQDRPNPSQLAWLFRSKQIAEVLSVSAFSEKKLRIALSHLRSLMHNPKETRHVPHILANAGIRYLAIEGLTSTKIDGACFWLDHRSPVIAMSLRHDRIDNFWFVLRHEIEHVIRGDGKKKKLIDTTPDTELEGAHALSSGDIPKEEKIANKAASEFCVPGEQLDDFIARVGPYYSTRRIEGFAARIGVHPGLVVGQLHNRKELPFSHLRKFLVRVRQIITETAFVDGWGYRSL